MADLNDVVVGLQQAVADVYHSGEETGALHREEGDPLVDTRVNDGFTVRFQGKNLYITYSLELPRAEVHGKGYEFDLSQTLADLASYLKKRYKQITKDSVQLTKEGEPVRETEYVSKIRVLTRVTQCYKISGV